MKDRETLERFARNDVKIQDGDCPNDCGEMKQNNPSSWECPKCGFLYTISKVF